MSGTLNININANAGNTQSTFAGIAASIAAMDAQLKAAGLSAKSFEASINNGAASLSSVSVAAQGAAGGMNNFGHATNGAMRELMVIGHEALSGRFSRIPGSLMVMTERMGGLSLATMGLVGAFALAALGAVHLVEWLDRIKAAKAEGEQSSAYFNPAFSDKTTDAQIDSLRRLSGVTTEEAGKVVATYNGMRGATQAQIQAMIDVTASYAQATGKNMEGAAQAIRAVMEAPSTKGREFLSSFADSTQTLAAFDKITGDTAPMQRRLVIMQELIDANLRAQESTHVQPTLPTGDFSGLSSAQAAARAGRASEGEGVEDAQAAKLAKMRADAQAAMANMSNEEVAGGGQAQTWFEKQQEGADQLKDKIISTATNYKTAMQQADTALAAYWKNVASQAVQGSKEQVQATEEYLRYKDAAEMSSMRLSTQNTETEFKAQLAALSAQQAAAGQNKDLVLSLEQQKLDLFVTYNKQGTAAYEEELRRQAELLNKYKAQETSEALEAINQQIEADSKLYANKETTLNAEVKAHALSKDQEIEQLSSANQTMEASELQALDALIATLTAGTEAYRKAMADREKAVQDFNTRQVALNAQSLNDSTKTASGTEKVFDNAFNTLGNEGESTFQKLISRQETFSRAGLNMAGALVSAVANACVQMVARWVAMEVAKTTATTTQNAVRTAQDAGGSGLTVLISKTLAQWLGLETTKTAITTTATTTRTAVATAGEASQTAVTVAGQAAQTSAVVAGGAAQTAATVTAAAASKGAVAAINGPTIIGYAAKAAAGAYSAVAGIPIVGPILAPIAAGTAFAAVAAYESLASFDTGAYNLPDDMIAQVHKGEMIIPAAQASQLRTSMGTDFNVPAFTPNMSVNRMSGDSFSSVGSGNNMTFTQNLAMHAAPGSTVGAAASSMLNRARKDAYSMLWEAGRNGGLKPRNI